MSISVRAPPSLDDDEAAWIAGEIGFVPSRTIVNLRRLLGRRDPRQRIVLAGENGLAAARFGKFRRCVVQRHRAERTAFVQRS